MSHTIEYTFRRQTASGEESMTRTTVGHATTADAAIAEFYAKAQSMFSWAGTLAIIFDKIVVKGTPSTAIRGYETVTEMRKHTPVQDYRIVIEGTDIDGGRVLQRKNYDATSGLHAMRKFWRELKEDGAGFCDDAAEVANLTFTVQTVPPADNSDTVLYKREAENLDGDFDTFGVFRASYNSDCTRARIVNTETGEVSDYNSEDLWSEFNAQDEDNSDYDEDLFAALDYLTDNVQD